MTAGEATGAAVPGATSLTLLTRDGCHLCDDMHEALASLALTLPLPPLLVLDVDSDEVLARRYALDLPVLLLDGALVCKHRLDEAELRRLLRPR